MGEEDSREKERWMIRHPKLKLGLSLIVSSRLFTFPGLFSLRQVFYRLAFGFRDVKVEEDVWFVNLKRPSSALRVGRKVVFQKSVTIDCYGGVDIADNVVFSRGSAVFTHEHQIHDKSVPWREQGERPSPLKIETDVWICAGAMILPRVNVIGRGSIVGAGAVVTKDVEPYSIVGGNPARVIGKRE